jgi:hypothetical protein
MIVIFYVVMATFSTGIGTNSFHVSLELSSFLCHAPFLLPGFTAE